MPPEQPRYNLKKIIVIGVFLVAIAVIIGLIIANRIKKSAPSDAGKNLFPYGTTSTGGTTGTTPNSGDQQGTVPTPQSPLQLAGADRLRQIANYPVTDYYASLINKTSVEERTDPATGSTVSVPVSVATNMLRWNSKQTGILMDAEITDKLIVETQASKTRAPNAEELWIGSGSSFLYRSWNSSNRTIDTMTGAIAPKPTLDYCLVSFDRDLKRGDKGSDVKELQVYLNKKLRLGLATDGSFGAKLVTALKTYQKAEQLAQTGLLDQATRGAINDDCRGVVTAFEKQKSEPANLGNVGFLASNILRGDVSPDGTKVFYLVKSARGVSGIIANIDGSNTRNLFTSPVSEWKPQWINAGTIAMTTLASREADGYLYFLNVSTGELRKILGPIRGLTTLVSPDGQTILLSQSTDRGLRTGWYKVATGIYTQSDLATLPQKCSWSDNITAYCGIPQTVQNGTYPDDWYQGTVSFSDTLWSINVETGATTSILSPEQSFDMTHVRTSPDGAYAYFINKTDGTLWSYRMK